MPNSFHDDNSFGFFGDPVPELPPLTPNLQAISAFPNESALPLDERTVGVDRTIRIILNQNIEAIRQATAGHEVSMHTSALVNLFNTDIFRRWAETHQFG